MAAEPLPPPDVPEGAIELTTDGSRGVMKFIKKEGQGEDKPVTGDKVSVHYVGTLTDGSKFDSSRDRGDLFEFELNKGSVIKAWDLGVATMKKGEVAVLYCAPEYAYGEAGSPPKIPPKSHLIFEIELFHWKGDDISELRDGGIIRSIIDQGTGWANPNEGARVKVNLIGRYGGSVFDERKVEYELGEPDEHNVIDGIDVALRKFKKGERAKLKIAARYAFGSKGSDQFNIPPNAEIFYEVHLEDFEKAKEKWEMDDSEKLEQSEIVKSKGTTYFKKGDYRKAITWYKKILTFLDADSSADDGGDDTASDDADKPSDAPATDVKEPKTALILAGHLNLAMCYLKVDDNHSAIQHCSKALKLDPNNEKGLFRRATAHMQSRDYEWAVKDFTAVLNIDAANKTARKQMIACKKEIKVQKVKDKQLFGGMFDKFAKIDAEKEEAMKAAEIPTETEKKEDGEKPEAKEDVETKDPPDDPMVTDEPSLRKRNTAAATAET